VLDPNEKPVTRQGTVTGSVETPQDTSYTAKVGVCTLLSAVAREQTVAGQGVGRKSLT
jgi:hypothetical protein